MNQKDLIDYVNSSYGELSGISSIELMCKAHPVVAITDSEEVFNQFAGEDAIYLSFFNRECLDYAVNHCKDSLRQSVVVQQANTLASYECYLQPKNIDLYQQLKTSSVARVYLTPSLS